MSAENLLWAAGGTIIGLLLGLSINAARVRDDQGRRSWRVWVDPGWPRWFFIAVGVLAVFSVAGTAINNTENQRIIENQRQQVARQTFCNRELVRVIDANAEVSRSDRANLRELLATVGGQILNPSPERSERSEIFREAFRKYYETEARNAAARQPYPPPNCGE